MRFIALFALFLIGITTSAFCSEGVDDVVRLQRANVGSDVVLAFVENSRVAYDLTADDMIRLEDSEVPATVILAMIERGNELRDKPEIIAPPEGRGDISLFYETLAPYGTWSQEADYGWVWEPTDGRRDSNWRPYTNDGHWTWTNHGWYWESSTPYGWAVFHYGRWGYNSRHRWVWVPDNVWGPAWVDWRHSDDYVGWAPLPIGSHFNTRIGFSYQGRNVGFDFNFGQDENRYSYIPANRFLDINIGIFLVPEHRRRYAHNHTTVIRNTYIYNDNRIINNGVPTAAISAATHKSIEQVLVVDAKAEAGKPIRGERRRGDRIESFRPKISNEAKIEPTEIVERQKAESKRESLEPSKRQAARERLKSEKEARQKLAEAKEKAKEDKRVGLKEDRAQKKESSNDQKAENKKTEESRKTEQDTEKEAKAKVNEANDGVKIQPDSKRLQEASDAQKRDAERKKAAEEREASNAAEKDARAKAKEEKAVYKEVEQDKKVLPQNEKQEKGSPQLERGAPGDKSGREMDQPTEGGDSNDRRAEKRENIEDRKAEEKNSREEKREDHKAAREAKRDERKEKREEKANENEEDK